MSAFYSEMQEKLNQWSEYPLKAVEAKLFEDAIVHHNNDVFKMLTLSTNSDSKTQELLQLLFPAFKITTRLLLNHLPGDLYCQITDEQLISKTKSVTK